MDRSEKIFWAAASVYAAMVPVVFGFAAHTFLAVSRDISAIFAAGVVAAVWPLSGLIWLGSWLAS